MGLRSLYFLLAGAMGKFHYLQPALAIILLFIGGKMLISHYFEIPIGISLAVVIGVLALAIVGSLIRQRRLQKV